MGDHQHSTRVVLAHVATDVAYVRQSLDYAQFGRVTATLGANGLADATGVVTVFGHHGSVTDAATGLQQKGERWYSPDLGRFVSEDPIQDGSNWFMFSGNDPVNQRDPSGLFQQGHPLKGGSASLDNFLRGAVNQSLNSTRFPSTTFGGFVDAERGRQILGQPAAPKTSVRTTPAPSKFDDFNRGLTNSVYLSAMTTPNDPLKAVVQQQREIDAYRASQALDDLRRINHAELAEIAYLQANRNADPLSVVYRNSRAAGQGIIQSSYNAGGTVLATMTGVRGVSDLFSQHDAVDAHVQSGWERAFDGVTGAISLAGTAAPIAGALRTTMSSTPTIGPVISPVSASRELTILNQNFVPNTQRVLQNVTNKVSGEVLANPRLLRPVVGTKSYSHLVHDTAQADRIFGKGIEKLVNQRIIADEGLSSILVRATQRGAGGRFIRSPDFIGMEGNQIRLLEMTTLKNVQPHLRRPAGSAVDFVIQPGLRGPVRPVF